jgi:hypothetical protein
VTEKRKFDEIGNEINPEDSKGKKLGMCGSSGCCVTMAKWKDIPRDTYVCDGCANDRNNLAASFNVDPYCTLEASSAVEASALYDPVLVADYARDSKLVTCYKEDYSDLQIKDAERFFQFIKAKQIENFKTEPGVWGDDLGYGHTEDHIDYGYFTRC